MQGAAEAKTRENNSSQLQNDLKCFQDALKTFFQPLKTDDPRLDFYTMYKNESTEYDEEYVKKYDEDLNTTLIFAGLFSAVCSAFVIEIYPKLQPNPGDQSVALLRAILLTLNNSAIPNESPTVPPIQQDPPSEIVTVTGLLYASLLISLLAAFVAMLGKQWLVRYRRHAGGSMIERCGDRQRKYDGLQKWPFRFFIDSLPVMLQVSLLLLACALCRYMASINTPITYVLIALTSFGLLFYVGIAIAGASSYECPFQMPGSALLRNSWKKVGPRLFPIVLPIISAVENITLGYISAIRSLLVNTHHHLRFLLERVQLGILHIALFLPSIGLNIRRRSRNPPLPMTLEVSHPLNPQDTVPWFTKNELAVIQGRNTYDVWCVAWISFVGIAYNAWTPDATASLTSLLESQGQWEKLECWMGVTWIASPPEPDGMSEDFNRAMASLFRQRPGAARKLARWMERWSQEWYEDIPETFHQICQRGREEAPDIGLLDLIT